jgi:hypothetical protein
MAEHRRASERSPERAWPAVAAGACGSQRFGGTLVADHDELGEPVIRNGVPQARHAHAPPRSGQRRLRAWLPANRGELLAHGALPFRAKQFRWFQVRGGLRLRDANSNA